MFLASCEHRILDSYQPHVFHFSEIIFVSYKLSSLLFVFLSTDWASYIQRWSESPQTHTDRSVVVPRMLGFHSLHHTFPILLAAVQIFSQLSPSFFISSLFLPQCLPLIHSPVCCCFLIITYCKFLWCIRTSLSWILFQPFDHFSWIKF